MVNSELKEGFKAVWSAFITPDEDYFSKKAIGGWLGGTSLFITIDVTRFLLMTLW